MPQRPHHRTRLAFLAVSLGVAALASWAVAPGPVTETSTGLVAAAAGYALGLLHWRRIRSRIDRRNFVILYTADGLAYLLLVTLFLLKYVGLARVAGLLWRNSPVFEAVLVGLAALTAGYNLALYLRCRAHESAHGPLATKSFYSRSVTGAEGMIGLGGRVARACRPEGTVEVHGEIWNAVSADGKPLRTGETVRVVDLEGLLLVVESARGSGA
jgi:membrane protein implicated in regulation of membrane protease activity